MKLAIAYSTKDRVELTKQTIEPLLAGIDKFDLHWVDGSTEPAERNFPFTFDSHKFVMHSWIVGGADAAISYKLSTLLQDEKNYTHIGLLENDVLLDPDWLAPTLELFEKGKQDGLAVGAVSPRSYVDRVLIQRDQYAVMHNIGAGVIIFTREGAEIALRSFRTQWWPDNTRLFAQLSGVDLRSYAAFRGNEQWITTDWGWEAQLARHGLASLALTPAKCEMIGQVPPLHEQGLVLTQGPVDARRNEKAFDFYRSTLAHLGPCVDGRMLSDGWSVLRREGNGLLVFPHQVGCLSEASWQGNLVLQWCQAHGPFAYRAGKGGASLGLLVSGICVFLVSGGRDGARVTIEDMRSGFKTAPDLPSGIEPISINVPGGPIPRTVKLHMDEGAVFYGLQTADPQMIDTMWKFSWDQLPEAE